MLLGGTITAVLVSVLIMADTLIAGIMLGEAAAAAINLVLPVYSLASFFSMVISLGVPILYARYTGAFQREKADHVFGVGIFLSIITGIILFVIMSAAGTAFLTFFSPDSQIQYYAEEYLRWIKYAILIMPVQELLFDMVYADGDTLISTAGNIFTSAGNILLSVVLCGSMGMQGLSLGTFLSLFISVLIQFLHFPRKGNTLRLNIRFSLRTTITIIRISMVDSCTYLFLFLFTSVMNRYVIHAFGAEMLILVSVISLVRETQLLFDGIGEAVTPIMSIYLGEKNYPGIREIWDLAKRTTVLEGLAVSGFLFAFAPLIVSFLEIENPETLRIACWGMRIISLSLIFTCYLFLHSSYVILVNRISLGILESALRDVVLPLIFAISGGMAFGVYGMFAGIMVSQPAGCLLSYLYIRTRYGKENYPLFLAEKDKDKKNGLFEFLITPETVVKTRDQIRDMLKDNGYETATVKKTMLIFEEALIDIYERNNGRRVLAECFVEMSEHVRMIIKDDGELYDLTDTDRNMDSFQGFLRLNLISSYAPKRVHFLALSFNRNVFDID